MHGMLGAVVLVRGYGAASGLALFMLCAGSVRASGGGDRHVCAVRHDGRGWGRAGGGTDQRPRAVSAPPPMSFCIHEAGHAVAHFVINDSLAEAETIVRSLSVDPATTRGNLGLVRIAERARGRDPRNDVVRHLAGYCAENYAEHGPTWQPIAADFAAHLHLTDLRRASEVVATLGFADPAAELLRLWRVTHRVVDQEWPAIVAVGRVLRDRMVLTGAEAEAVWRSARRVCGWAA